MKQVNGLWRLGTIAAVGVAGAAVVVAVGRGGPVLDEGTPMPHETAGLVTLAGYNSCDAALENLRDAARPYVGPYGIGGGDVAVAESGGPTARGDVAVPDVAPAQPGAADSKAAPPEHSGTTVNEAGVDEPDLVKNDGRRIVSVVDGTVRVIDAATHKLTGSAMLPQGAASNLLLDGDRALVMVGNGIVEDRAGPGSSASGGATTLVLVDLTDGVRVLGSLELTGTYVDARQTGHEARVVVRSTPQLKFVYPNGMYGESTARKQNLSILDDSTLDDWLPSYRLTTDAKTTEGRLVDCAAIRHPAEFSGTSMLTVLSLDLAGDLGTGDPVSIVADGDTVYGSGQNLYVADDHRLRPPLPDTKFAPQSANTAIYQFDTAKPGKPGFVASGTVAGSLLNQYSLSEFDGTLRVATTTGNDNSVTVLRRKGDQLVQQGRLNGLGVGERIYAVRFIGDRGYVVTFRQTDPLYTVDLSDPRNPRKAGELKLNGYSAYLHDAGNGKLIGVGADATSGGQRTGMQVSLFDVTNAAAPTRLANYTTEQGWSEAESDPHAFLYWAKTGTVVVPVASGDGRPGGGALVLKLAGDKLTQSGTLAQPRTGAMVRRTLVIGNELWSISDQGAQVSSLTGLAQQAWIPFG
jgi:uncharacterized secreted protein with C-terminal beta-propeller domain